jgi:hypothetical protein
MSRRQSSEVERIIFCILDEHSVAPAVVCTSESKGNYSWWQCWSHLEITASIVPSILGMIDVLQRRNVEYSLSVAFLLLAAGDWWSLLEVSGMCGPTGGEISLFLPEPPIGIMNC